jgi:glycosyltransferase involved in cell wall biosynthesis
MKILPITVILATYNGALYLNQQIDSILLQEYPIDEIIICDDNSIDNTDKILETYKYKTNLKWYKNENKLGVVGNFKKAALLATKNNYIAFSDQDDIWNSNKIKLQIECLQQIELELDTKKPAMVYSDLSLIDQSEKLINQSFWNEINHHNHKHCLSTILFGNYITGCTILMNNEMKCIFLEMPENGILHDHWLGLVSFTFGKSSGISSQLVRYRQHSNNLTYNINKSKETKSKLRINGFKNIFRSNQYLSLELKIADIFYKKYKNLLTKRQKIVFILFLKLNDLPYIFKPLLRKLYFLIQYV